MFTQKLSMDCTKEQYEKYLKVELEKMGYKEDSCSQWHKRENEYITNCYIGLGNVGNVNKVDIYNIVNDKLTYLGKFNAPLFLALAAMTDNFEGGYREYYVKDDEFYSMKESGFLGANGLFRKATVSEIMAKFGEQLHKGKITFDIKFDAKELSEQIEKLAMGIQVNQYLIDIEGNVRKLFNTNEMKTETDKLIDELQQQAKAMLAALDELKKERELKHKEPIIGEMAIAWHNNKKTAAIGILQEVDNSEFPYFVPTLGWCANAILFESPEQYKAFVNE